MHFSSSSAAALAVGIVATLLADASVATAAKRGEGAVLKPYQKQQAQDYAKSKQLKSRSSCVPMCKSRPGNYGCQVVLGAAAGGGAGLDACCKKACGG